MKEFLNLLQVSGVFLPLTPPESKIAEKFFVFWAENEEDHWVSVCIEEMILNNDEEFPLKTATGKKVRRG